MSPKSSSRTAPRSSWSTPRIDQVREFVEHDPEALSRPRTVKPPIGGAAILESPLRAARRRGRTELVAYLVEHGAV